MSEKHFIGTEEGNDIAEFLNRVEQNTGKRIQKAEIKCDETDVSNRTLHVSLEFDPYYNGNR